MSVCLISVVDYLLVLVNWCLVKCVLCGRELSHSWMKSIFD